MAVSKHKRIEVKGEILDERIYELREKAKDDGNPILRDKSFELLIETIKKLKPKTILEIGTNVGLSSVSMLLSSENATLSGIELDEETAQEAKENFKKFGVETRAKIFLGDASNIIPLLTGKYDFIFLDGPKGHYHEYVEFLLPLLNKGGILFADNVLFRGYVLDKVETPKRDRTIKNSLKKFIDRISNDGGLETTILDIEDGVSITKKITE